MAQVSLYLDKNTYDRVEFAADSGGVSISKYVASILQDHFNHEWTPEYAGLFGSVSDNTFFPDGAEKITQEAVRESL